MRAERVLAVAGASGGHIFPAIGFLDDFKAAYPDTQTLLVLPVRSIKKDIVFSGHPVRDISVSTLSLRPSLANIKAAINFVKGFFESAAILAQFKPDIVVGFGSIASIPVVSCEGACIRGEIARLAANYVAKRSNFKRGCHGELFTVPESKIA